MFTIKVSHVLYIMFTIKVSHVKTRTTTATLCPLPDIHVRISSLNTRYPISSFASVAWRPFHVPQVQSLYGRLAHEDLRRYGGKEHDGAST